MTSILLLYKYCLSLHFLFIYLFDVELFFFFFIGGFLLPSIQSSVQHCKSYCVVKFFLKLEWYISITRHLDAFLHFIHFLEILFSCFPIICDIPKIFGLWCVVWYVNRTWYSFIYKHYRCAKEAGYVKWGELFWISTFVLFPFCLLTHPPPTHPPMPSFYSFEYLLPSHAFFLLVEYLVPTMPSFYSLNIWCWPLRNIRDLTI